MLYYRFDSEYEPAIIGVRDGMSQAWVHAKGFADKNLYRRMDAFFSYAAYWHRERHTPRLSHEPPESFVIEYAKLRPKAKLTDFSRLAPYYMACPFMLSARAQVVFAAHRIQRHFLLDTFIYDNKGSLVTDEYALFYCPLFDYDMIDFAKSRFRVNKSFPSSPDWEYHHFPNHAAYDVYDDAACGKLDVASLVMSEKFDATLDFFKCKIGGMYMSERLRAAVEKAELTGIYFPDKTQALAFADVH